MWPIIFEVDISELEWTSNKGPVFRPAYTVHTVRRTVWKYPNGRIDRCTDQWRRVGWRLGRKTWGHTQLPSQAAQAPGSLSTHLGMQALCKYWGSASIYHSSILHYVYLGL